MVSDHDMLRRFYGASSQGRRELAPVVPANGIHPNREVRVQPHAPVVGRHHVLPVGGPSTAVRRHRGPQLVREQRLSTPAHLHLGGDYGGPRGPKTNDVTVRRRRQRARRAIALQRRSSLACPQRAVESSVTDRRHCNGREKTMNKRRIKKMCDSATCTFRRLKPRGRDASSSRRGDACSCDFSTGLFWSVETVTWNRNAPRP